VSSIVENAFAGCEALKYAGSIKSIRFAESPIGNNTSIGSKAFSNCTGLKTIDLSSTNISSITNNAFDACINLTNISLPSSLTEIGSSAFAGCKALTTVDLSKTKLTSIGYYAFSRSDINYEFCGLTTINFPDSLETIAARAFYNCAELKTIDLSSTNISSIGDSAFAGCSGLTKIDFPDSLKSFGTYALSLCFSLEFITLPNSLEVISRGLFSRSHSLITINLNTNITSIGGWSFGQVFTNASIDFDLSNTAVTYIGDGAFYGCTKLITLKLPSTMFVTDNNASIDERAFAGCTGLNAIYIPKGAVANLGGEKKNDAFEDCGAEGKIYYYDESDETVAKQFKNSFVGLKDWTITK
jgi:Leucine-rich repeat (LRR) protein